MRKLSYFGIAAPGELENSGTIFHEWLVELRKQIASMWTLAAFDREA